ncbi:hypothetical protein GALMADRAFT_918932 [Galerina marginata CBS 339.88]|uniref:Uncharacterized protein n=1 Tax=Galerina marginata (strain CBS 339.88) TaxID=685588 RepID=A0A067SRD8_GALM3|nr:hypothetical protein GALMADRAFT_918932 [Galerina marginata CBS 339.88]
MIHRPYRLIRDRYLFHFQDTETLLEGDLSYVLVSPEPTPNLLHSPGHFRPRAHTQYSAGRRVKYNALKAYRCHSHPEALDDLCLDPVAVSRSCLRSSCPWISSPSAQDQQLQFRSLQRANGRLQRHLCVGSVQTNHSRSRHTLVPDYFRHLRPLNCLLIKLRLDLRGHASDALGVCPLFLAHTSLAPAQSINVQPMFTHEVG